jgi:hypothetical protein
MKTFLPTVPGATRISLAAFALAVGFQVTACANAYIDLSEAQTHPGFKFQGEFTGAIRDSAEAEPVDAALQVSIHGGQARGLLYYDSLPDGIDNHDETKIRAQLEGVYRDDELVLSGDGAPRFRYTAEGFVAFDDENDNLGQLNRIERQSPTLGLAPPESAITLFDGEHLEHWNDGARMDAHGRLIEGATTRESYGDFHLHMEMKLGFMPDSEGQGRANSGVYIQNRYEVQILDTFGQPPSVNGIASLYNFKAPVVNAAYPPLTWQTYDLYFRAPRFDDDGEKTENARVTVYLNGVLVQDNVELPQGTGMGASRAETPRAPLYLQSHSGPVRFQNIWLIPDSYDPPGADRLSPDS